MTFVCSVVIFSLSCLTELKPTVPSLFVFPTLCSRCIALFSMLLLVFFFFSIHVVRSEPTMSTHRKPNNNNSIIFHVSSNKNGVRSYCLCVFYWIADNKVEKTQKTLRWSDRFGVRVRFFFSLCCCSVEMFQPNRNFVNSTYHSITSSILLIFYPFSRIFFCFLYTDFIRIWTN